MSRDEGYDAESYDEDAYEESPAEAAHRRRRRKSLITVGVLLLALFFAFWWAYSYYKASSTGPRTTTAACRTPGPEEMTPAKVTVNVYNSTTRAGLAASAAQEFAAQGYAVGAVANDPLKHEVAGPAEVRFGPAGKAGADLVLASLGEGAVVVEDQRADASVDVALGQAYVKLGPLPGPADGRPLCTAPSASASATPSPAAS